MEIFKVCPPESELSEIITNIKCTEQGCTSVFPNTSTLEMHLIKTHNKHSNFLAKKKSNCTFRYFCPVKECKYELHAERSDDQLRWFTRKKYLKQVNKLLDFNISVVIGFAVISLKIVLIC